MDRLFDYWDIADSSDREIRDARRRTIPKIQLISRTREELQRLGFSPILRAARHDRHCPSCNETTQHLEYVNRKITEIKYLCLKCNKEYYGA
jgi:hypothetical protein